MPPIESYFAMTNVFWKRPENWRDIINGVQWAANEEFPITVEGPDFLVANCKLQRQNQRLLLHFVNYYTAKTPAISGTRVRVVLPQNKKARTATLYAPEFAEARALALSSDRANTASRMSRGFQAPTGKLSNGHGERPK